MFSVVSVILSRGIHVTITHDALAITVYAPWPCPLPNMGPHCTGTPTLPANGIW